MAESTLNTTIADLRSSVGRFLGIGRTEADWNDNSTEVDEIIERGLRQFYHPPAVSIEPGRPASVHQWSWLKPWTTIDVWPDRNSEVSSISGTTVNIDDTDFPTDGTAVGQRIKFTASGNSFTISSVTDNNTAVATATMGGESDGDDITLLGGNYSLPDNFGGMDRYLTFESDTGYPAIPLTSTHMVERRRMDSSSANTGRPRIAAIRLSKYKLIDSSHGSRYELVLWPTPDKNYTLRYRYLQLRDAPGTTEFPAGGLPHYETALASCLAVAEEYSDPNNTDRQKDWQHKLISSILLDRTAFEADNLGYNGDATVSRPFNRHILNDAVAVNGTTWTR
jgi:hypothetical protein